MVVKAAQRDRSESATDEVKERAIKFVITGDPHSSRIAVNSHGKYASGASLYPFYKDELGERLRYGYYIIGNYFARQNSFFHSVVIREEEKRLLLYDPWDGTSWSFSAEQLFVSGFITNLGGGTIEWVQYVERPPACSA